MPTTMIGKRHKKPFICQHTDLGLRDGAFVSSFRFPDNESLENRVTDASHRLERDESFLAEHGVDVATLKW